LFDPQDNWGTSSHDSMSPSTSHRASSLEAGGEVSGRSRQGGHASSTPNTARPEIEEVLGFHDPCFPAATQIAETPANDLGLIR
jgi:hypothetical protein